MENRGDQAHCKDIGGAIDALAIEKSPEFVHGAANALLCGFLGNAQGSSDGGEGAIVEEAKCDDRAVGVGQV